ncbi:MAG: hypothetical protein Q4A82_01050 [Corynebacterium sp.]|nr:hypothetical protein [Corynebacterium sp.]
MKLKKNYLIRCFAAQGVGGTSGGSAGTTSQGSTPPSDNAETQTSPTAEPTTTTDKPTNDDDATKTPDHSDELARERAQREAVEKQLAEMEAKLKQLTGKQTPEQQAKSEHDELIARLDKLESERNAEQRAAHVKAALDEYKIPADWAGRVKGTTVDEIKADAKALSELIGYDKKPVDPSQGQSGTPPRRSLSEEIYSYYNK